LTDHKSTPEDLTASAGNIRTGLAVASMIAMLTLGTAVTALAGGGGVGTGGGTGGGGGGGGTTGDRYDREWDSFSEKDKKWAHKTSECEAGPNEDPNIHDPSGTYHGAFQFLKSTWKTSPMSPGGDPHRYSWKTQAVVAVKLKHRQGSSPWPVCG
jgi:hypothetical protein